MPPWLQAFLANRIAVIATASGVAVIVVVALFLTLQPKPAPVGGGTLEETQLQIATTTSPGKALEMMALLAREGLRVTSNNDPRQPNIMLTKEATKDDKDRAIITLVQSGLMDRNIGLEAFDTGDLTASREEKRIKLVRAQQGELARLIRKIDPIQDASVSLSIPEPTLFKSEQKPLSASVQVTLGVGERLTRDKVRAIINLVVGAIQGLDANHVALSDTNGNTYSSVLDLGAEMTEKLEEQDAYMRQKVATQLDKLIGNGHYVVTVSTQLREVTRETLTQNYDPNGTVVQTRQSFSESMNAGQKNAGGASGPTSTMVPNGLTRWMASGPPFAYPPPQQGYPEPPKTLQVPKNLVPYTQGKAMPATQTANQNPNHNHAQTTATIEANGMSKDVSTASNGKGYERNGSEVAYATGRTQTLETAMPGVLEDISVAVSVDKNHMPAMSPDELKALVARAASPRVSPDSVSIAITDFNMPKAKSDGDTRKPAGNQDAMDPDSAPDLPPEEQPGASPAWLPWLLWGGVSLLLLGVLVVVLLLSQSNRQDKTKLSQTQQDLEALRDMALDQQMQIQAAQSQAQMAMQNQQQQQQAREERDKATAAMRDTLKELQSAFSQQDPTTLTQKAQQWMNQ
jgi:flagellar biosynthesis/type III secretory pathway M-ring protein FliF/YscJ